jgi:hypothetical protein
MYTSSLALIHRVTLQVEHLMLVLMQQNMVLD